MPASQAIARIVDGPGREPSPVGEQAIRNACEASAERLRATMPDAEVTVVLRGGSTLRQVAHRGSLRVIYEFPRDLGGVIWRAVEREQTQLVRDVRVDPDFIAVDTTVRSEIAAPITVDGEVVGVLNAETPVRRFEEDDVALVEAEAARLAYELRRAYGSS
jgi:GAF domain-containing protein